MKTSPAAMLKQMQDMEAVLQQIVQPQIVRRVVDEDPDLVLDRMIADGEIAASQRDDVLIIRRLIVDPKTSDGDLNITERRG